MTIPQTRIFEISSPEELHGPAAAVAALLEEYPVAAFYGPMGAGKTTLIREIARRLGVEDTVTSPTFAIVNAYSTREGRPVYHFDFYRIDSPGEAFDLGYEEYFYGGDPCLIEWPEKIETLLPENTLSVIITPHPSDPSARTVAIRKP
ncbi:MAG: tRNA (adenosine(37)-N6)-threonylcarbamoyltransferase complex ATPase subunit type 1 TsaE [Rikenellaceae bacterium]|nr:tRNA (adenosine(37)-N6)-threonylcarbamoyltransferase complex ATPase subunit type 1 TsaE [Rikenellaceae bacterium]